MASPSAPVTRQLKDRVFLSFGDDIKKDFISHLRREFRLKLGEDGIFTADDLPTGVEMSTISTEIEDSKVSVIVLSVGYASDPRCLRELAKIVDCRGKHRQGVIPVLHGVQKWDVQGKKGEKEEKGQFGKAFDELEKQFKEEWKEWKSALEALVGLKFWNSMTDGNEQSLAENIVSDALNKLKLSTSDRKGEVGIYWRAEKLEKQLSPWSKMTCTLGIWGNRGSGKTTLAWDIYERFSRRNRFEVPHFVENVSRRSDGKRRQDRMLQELATKMGPDKMVPKRILIVLDDVTQSSQVDLLTRGLWFGMGSLVIIIARFKSVLDDCSPDEEFEVERLSSNEALKLFKWSVYGDYICQDVHPFWSRQMVECANYGPLALKVLGSCLFGKIKKDWERVLKRLSDYRPLDIYKVLRIGYEELDHEEKKLFKEIVVWDGHDVDDVKEALNRTFNSTLERGIKVLVQRSLISIIDKKIKVLDLIKDMHGNLPSKRTWALTL